MVVHKTLAAPADEAERRVRADRAAALAATRPSPVAAAVGGSSGAAGSALELGGGAAESAAARGPPGELWDEGMGKDAPLPTLPDVLGSDVHILRVPCTEPADLQPLLGEVLSCFTLARSPTAPGLIGLHLSLIHI